MHSMSRSLQCFWQKFIGISPVFTKSMILIIVCRMALLGGSSIDPLKFSCSEMLLSAGCWQTLLAEKDVITSWTKNNGLYM